MRENRKGEDGGNVFGPSLVSVHFKPLRYLNWIGFTFWHPIWQDNYKGYYLTPPLASKVDIIFIDARVFRAYIIMQFVFA